MTPELYLGREEKLVPSRKVYWIVTDRCNLNCVYCYYHTGLEDKARFLNVFSEAKENLIRRLPSFFNELIFTGGEPLLQGDIYDLIREGKSNGLRIGLLTNGVLLTPKNCQTLVDLGVDCVSISLDSLDPQINDRLRGKSRKVLGGIFNLLQIKPSNMTVEIMMTVSKPNIDSIRPLVDFCKEKGLKLWLDPVEINDSYSNLQQIDLTKMSDREKQRLEEEMYYWAEQMGNPSLSPYVVNVMELIRGKSPPNIFCPMGTDNFVIDADGSMHPCFMRKDINMGNVYERDLDGLITSPLIIGKQQELQKAECVRLGCICMTISGNY